METERGNRDGLDTEEADAEGVDRSRVDCGRVETGGMDTRGVATRSVDTGAPDADDLDTVKADTGARPTRETGGWKSQCSGVAMNVPVAGLLAAVGFNRSVPTKIFLKEGKG